MTKTFSKLPRSCPVSRWIAVAVCCFCFLVLSGCDYVEAYRRGKQVGTYARLQTISLRVQDSVDRGETVTEALLRSVIQDEGDGRDTWGNAYRFAIMRRGESVSWIVLSLGSDGRCDLSNIRQYFGAKEEVVSGQFERDIVFRDGKPLKNAGK